MEGKENELTKEWMQMVDLENVEFQIKIGDLGFAKIQTNAQDLQSTYCGTPINMAPEILNCSQYNYKADVWSLGTIIFEMLTGYSPFRDARTKE